MTLLRRERVDGPEMMRRFFDGDWETGWVRVEEFRDDDTYVMRTELPGVDPDKDVEIAVEDDTLHVRAEKEEKTENTAKDGYRTEFRYGSFVRDMRGPHGTKAEDVKATYKDGMLEIRVPLKTEPEAAPAKVTVKRS